MKASIRHGSSLFAVSLVTLASGACAPSGPSAEELNTSGSGGSAGAATGGNSNNSGSSSGGSTTAGSGTTGGSAGSGSLPVGGVGGSNSGGGAGPTAGTGGGGGSGGMVDIGPYAPRTGSFKMLVLTRTKGYRHDGSIGTGRTMLNEIAQEQGFEITEAGSTPGSEDAEIAAAITLENLANYEIIFSLNTTGDVYNEQQQQIFEEWMTQHDGAFAGVHSATDTENGWAFYSEVTGQYYDTHTSVTTGTIEFESAMADHPAVKGLPNPWTRQEEWYKFDGWQTWSQKPGFSLLSKRTGVTEHNVPTAFMWVREWSNFRSFYTAMGHDSVVFQDPQVKKHITGGIMWAVRRESLIK